MTELSLTREQTRQIMLLAGFTGDADIRFLKRHNHVWELITPEGTFFLKAPSKDWYGGDVEREGPTVNHEVEAWDCLAASGLTVPETLRTRICMRCSSSRMSSSRTLRRGVIRFTRRSWLWWMRQRAR